MPDDELYKGYLIVPHYGAVDVLHYHYGVPNELGRVPVPMDCQGPAVKVAREMYGSNNGGCETVEECRSEIDQFTT